MSAYAATLPAAQRPAYLAAVAAAGALLRTITDDLNSVIRVRGPRAAAGEAHSVRSGSKTADEVEDQILALIAAAGTTKQAA